MLDKDKETERKKLAISCGDDYRTIAISRSGFFDGIPCISPCSCGNLILLCNYLKLFCRLVKHNCYLAALIVCDVFLPWSPNKIRHNKVLKATVCRRKNQFLLDIEIWSKLKSIIVLFFQGAMDEKPKEFKPLKQKTELTEKQYTRGYRTQPRFKNIVHLWEFLLELLEEESCRSLISWNNKERREFKLRNPEEVAKRWGMVKRRRGMNYEKLSRALRFYYAQGIIKKVS